LIIHVLEEGINVNNRRQPYLASVPCHSSTELLKWKHPAGKVRRLKEVGVGPNQLPSISSLIFIPSKCYLFDFLLWRL
jgi:hypothetical protein